MNEDEKKMCAYNAGHKNLNALHSESQKIFRGLIEDIRVGIFMADANNILFYVNHAFNEMFGFPNHTHATGKNWTTILFNNPKIHAQFLETFQSTGFIHDFEIDYVNQAGQQIFLSLTAHPIRGDLGEIIGIQGALIDTTERNYLKEQLHCEHQKLIEILHFYNHISEINILDDLNIYIVSKSAQLLDAKRCSLMFVDTLKNELYVKASYGIEQEFLEMARVKIGEPVAGLIALRSQGLIVENIEYHDLFKRQKRKSYSNNSFLSAPLIYNQKLIGIINVSERERKFSIIDLEVLETIAKQAVINICKTQMLNNYEYLSFTDPMTGLNNFRWLHQRLEEEIVRTTRYQQGLSLMMIDVDHFKIYNDTHGHPQGDKLLCHIAEIFKKNLRSTEHICRYGGDEFCIILPNMNGMQAAIVAEKLRARVIAEFFEAKISLSIGIAQFQNQNNKKIFIQRADLALYQAKQSGRNQVIIAPINVITS